MRFFGCIGFIVVLLLIIGGCVLIMQQKDDRKYGGRIVEEAPVVLDETPTKEKTEKSAIEKLSPAVDAQKKLPVEEAVLNEKIQEWAMIHFTADYQKYITAGDAIKKCDDGMTAIKEELESAGLGNNINQNKAYNRLLQEKVGAIKERNRYAQRIIAAYAENIGNTAADVAAKDSGVSDEESLKYRHRGKFNSGKSSSGEPASKRFRSIKRTN